MFAWIFLEVGSGEVIIKGIAFKLRTVKNSYYFKIAFRKI